jgi:hypothetical protein
MSSTTSVASQRAVRSTAAVLRWQGVDPDGEPADPGTVTIGVVDSEGTVVVAAGSATTGSGSNPRTYTLSAAQTADLDVLTATWTVSGTVVAVTTLEIVGDVYVSASDVRLIEPALGEVPDYSTAKIHTARAQVEQMFEDACNRAFVPRFRVDTLRGSGRHWIVTRRPDVRAVRWANYTDYNGTVTTVDVSELEFDELGVIKWRDDVWPSGYQVKIGYEYGLSRPPEDLRQAAVQAIRAQLNTFRSGIPDRATSFQPIDGGNVILATPGVGQWVTGIPAVDECLKRYRWHDVAVA